jgi:hypothetical protein
MNAKVVEVRHLYQHAWQWGLQGSPVAYDMQHMLKMQPYNDNHNCSFLNIIGRQGRLVTLYCLLSVITVIIKKITTWFILNCD